MAKFRNKYRIESARLQGWDYRNSGAYFITICTHGRVHHFGKCENGRMKLSTLGLIVQGCWFEIPRLNSHVRLGEFIVMPNHVHGILILESLNLDDVDDVETFYKTSVRGVRNDGDVRDVDANTKKEFHQNISPKSGSVSRIIQQFKRAATYHIKLVESLNFNGSTLGNFKWQSRFHDHIIRDDESFVRISNYIVNNPLKWMEDKFYGDE